MLSHVVFKIPVGTTFQILLVLSWLIDAFLLAGFSPHLDSKVNVLDTKLFKSALLDIVVDRLFTVFDFWMRHEDMSDGLPFFKERLEGFG